MGSHLELFDGSVPAEAFDVVAVSMKLISTELYAHLLPELVTRMEGEQCMASCIHRECRSANQDLQHPWSVLLPFSMLPDAMRQTEC